MVQGVSERPLNVDWEIVLVTIAVVSQLSSIASNSMKIREVLIAWIKEMRKKKIASKAVLKSFKKGELNLETATEEDISEWFS